VTRVELELLDKKREDKAEVEKQIFLVGGLDRDDNSMVVLKMW
jgi:hypothetical protein